ncbi:hypothetical protein BDZ89DRAFT_1197957 [Hymenopellis radicata]|nr:hypothetical protein BDZ89DRAFT_1197957 [Hymenopellis radicata]
MSTGHVYVTATLLKREQQQRPEFLLSENVEPLKMDNTTGNEGTQTVFFDPAFNPLSQGRMSVLHFHVRRHDTTVDMEAEVHLDVAGRQDVLFVYLKLDWIPESRSIGVLFRTMRVEPPPNNVFDRSVWSRLAVLELENHIAKQNGYSEFLVCQPEFAESGTMQSFGRALFNRYFRAYVPHSLDPHWHDHANLPDRVQFTPYITKQGEVSVWPYWLNKAGLPAEMPWTPQA